MNEPEIYIRLFLIVPLLVYTGTCILTRHKYISTMMFHGIVIMTITLTLFFHIRYLLRVIRRIFQNKIYQEEFGGFLILLAVKFVILSIYNLRALKKKHKRNHHSTMSM